MLKKYGKAIEQPQGPLPLHPHSEQMDGPTEPKRSEQDPCAGGSLAPSSLGQAAFPAPTVFLSAEHLFSRPIQGMWALERQSHSGERW